MIRANIAGVDYLFSGMELDTESGFSYCHKRYYHSKMGSFLSEDLLKDNFPWISPLSYCYNNPLRFIDPTGMFGTESEATDYKKANKLSGQIEKGNDGLWSINDYKNNVSCPKIGLHKNVKK